MGLWESTKRQLRSVIEWTTPAPDALFEKWSGNGDEIKNASKLIVNPGQGCVFVHGGAVRAVHLDPGTYEIKTSNIPFWTTLSKFMQAFESEHKVGLYFFKTTRILDQKWGTSSPVKYVDPVYKFPVALRAYGNFSYRIEKAAEFFAGVVGVAEAYTASDFRAMMAARLVQPLTDFFAESGYSYGDLDKQREELSLGIQKKLVPEFEKLGFAITDFRIEGTSFDEKTMERIDRIADMGAEAQAAAAVGLNYAQIQQLEAMREAARNEGGGAGMGMGLGMGLGAGQALGSQMTQGLAQGVVPGAAQPGSQASVTPASGTPSTGDAEDPVAVLKKLKDMLDLGLITAADFESKKSEILKRM